MADEKKTIKFQMMMSPAEAEALDDWGFKRRIRSRAEVIRRLCQMALVYEKHRPFIVNNIMENSIIDNDRAKELYDKIHASKIDDKLKSDILKFISDSQLYEATVLFDVMAQFIELIPMGYDGTKSGTIEQVLAASKDVSEFVERAKKEKDPKRLIKFMHSFFDINEMKKTK